MKYARKCNNCSKGMNEGYIIDLKYYCNDSCRQTIMTNKQWEKHYSDDGDDYWSTWYDDYDDGYYTRNGEYIEV